MTKREQEPKKLKAIVESLPNYLDNEIVPTNSYILDNLLTGGVELGATIQIVGESGTGKSTLSLLIAKTLCEKGKNVVYLDTENSISIEMVKTMGLDEFMKDECRRFYYLRLSTFTEVEKKLDEFISTGEISLILCDSLAGLLNAGFTNLENGISINEATSSYNSRPLGMFMNKYKTLVGQRKIAFVFTNQYRNKIDIRGKTGTQEKEYGGKNIRHNSDAIIRINVCKDREFNNISEAYSKAYYKGIAETFELIKSNKSAPKNHPFHLVYGKGISDFCNHVYALRKLDIIKQAGTYYSILFQGQEIKENGMVNFIKKIKELGLSLYGLYTKEIDEFYKN